MTEYAKSNVVSLAHADLATKIRDVHSAVVGRMTDTILRAIEAGELLLVAKDRIPHGEFLGWLEANCGVSERCAQNYMKCAKGKPAILAEIEKLKSARHADLGTPSVDLTIGRALQVVK